MAIFDHPEFDSHERIIHVSDRATGLRAIIAVHDRTLGPAIGGCRVYPYAHEEAALHDVLRLSKGMTYKNALAGLPFGGGKSVIIADPSAKSPVLIAAMGRAINDLNGQYWTGEDVNMGPADIEELARHTPYVLGRSQGEQKSGDPSPFTAGGVFAAMKAALTHALGSDDFAGRRVAIQGLGNVGFELARLVHEAGGALTVADIRAETTERAARELDATVVAANEIYDAGCDVFAPCAMGGTVNADTVPRLKAKIICGAANNQLASPAIGQVLLDRGIAYAPDYVVNAGGILNASGEFHGAYDREEARAKVNAIGDTTLRILEASASERRPTHEIADALAETILADARVKREA
jgi:leucine dehydrogenase